LYRSCLFLFIALTPIQDFFLQATPLRSFGASPSLFPLAALGVLTAARWLVSGDLKIDRVFLACLGYTVAITIYGFFFFGFMSHGEDLIWKSAKSFIALALVILAANNLDYQVTSTVRAACYTAFFLLVAGFCLSNANPLGLPPLLEISVLHFTPIPDVMRPRGLASEPSLFSISAIVFGLLCAHFARSRAAKVTLLVMTVFLLVASGSKGGILTLFLCLMMLAVMRWHSKWYHVPGVILILLPLGLFLIWLIPNLFPETGISGSGSVTTRLSMIVCALITVGHHPLGVGLSGLLPAVGTYLPSAMYTVQSFFPVPLSFDEVALHLTSADMVGTMTFSFDQLMHFGIPFALCFSFFVVNLLKRLVAKRQLILAVAILASTIAITIYAHTFGLYSVPILFGVALSEVRSGKNTLGSE
jgi:hypothetical protein